MANENGEILPEFVGTLDLVAGTVSENGVVDTLQNWVFSYQSRLQEKFYEFMDKRDLTSDIQGLPGRKPYFQDDWYWDYPEQIDNRGLYPYELGYRSP